MAHDDELLPADAPVDVLTPDGHGTGAFTDPLDERDFRHEEISAAVAPTEAPVWEDIDADRPAQMADHEDPRGKVKVYGEINDQNGSGSCVAQTVSKMIGAENLLEEKKFLECSAIPIYARGFVGSGGMYPREGMKIGSEKGTTLKQLLPSDQKTEADMRKLDGETEVDRLIGGIIRGGDFVAVPVNLDTVATILTRGKSIAMSLRFASDLDPRNPQLDLNGQYGHEILLTTFGKWNGARGIFYQNSWHESWGFHGCGWIPESMFSKVESLWYYEDRKNMSGGAAPLLIKPEYTFTRTMKVGSNNAEVAMLQRCLGYLTDATGMLFPAGQAPTGYYGGITYNAVARFQALKGLPKTGAVDSNTIAALNVEF